MNENILQHDLDVPLHGNAMFDFKVLAEVKMFWLSKDEFWDLKFSGDI